MNTEVVKIISLILSIVAALPQLPGALNDYVRSISSQTALQAQRLEAMQNGEITIVDEQGFANFDLSDTSVKLNEIRTLHTHNSYKRALPESLYQLSAKVFGPDRFKGSMYEHDTPVKQLENGVRGLEFDIRRQLNGFKIFHQPAPDNLSNSPSWEMTLEELRLWSDANPNHVPVTILVEIKKDNPYWNPFYRNMNEDCFRELDNTIKTIMDNKAITAAQLMGNYPTLGAMVASNAWPALNDLKGKFIFLLHPDTAYTELYINMDKSLKTQMFVPMISNSDVTHYYEYAAFVLSNEPYDSRIKNLVNSHYIVRTMMDSGQWYNPARKAAALESGAQMLTTDLEQGVILPRTDYIATLENKSTIILRNN